MSNKKKSKEEKTLSVVNEIKALALINIQDIFWFTLSATDKQIEERYGTEEKALKVAREYLEIATHATMLEYPLSGWSIKYSQPVRDSDERNEYTAKFYDVKGADNE